MKRGLKVSCEVIVVLAVGSVEESSPMKRGLKVWHDARTTRTAVC